MEIKCPKCGNHEKQHQSDREVSRRPANSNTSKANSLEAYWGMMKSSPWSIRVASFLILLQVLASLVMNAYSDEPHPSQYGFAFFTFCLLGGILKAKRGARITLLIYRVLAILFAVGGLLGIGSSTADILGETYLSMFWGGIYTVVTSVPYLVLLYLPSANRWFGMPAVNDDLSHPKDVKFDSGNGWSSMNTAIMRTWRTAPLSVKTAVVLVSVFCALFLLVVLVIGISNLTFLLAGVFGAIVATMLLAAYNIFQGKNWTRVYFVTMTTVSFLSVIVNGFELAQFSGACWLLTISALLFCPGANRWFGSYPKGKSLWPISLLIIFALNFVVRHIPNTDNEEHTSVSTSNKSVENAKKQNVDAERLYRQGRDLIEVKDVIPGMRLVREAAEKGFPLAQYHVGWAYENGQNGLNKDVEMAVQWYKRAAENGVAEAQFALGMCYYEGKGVARYYSEAAKWLKKAAEQGLADAQYCLGNMYNMGYGVTKNQASAFMWYRKSAKNGNVSAHKKLTQARENRETSLYHLLSDKTLKKIAAGGGLIESMTNDELDKGTAAGYDLDQFSRSKKDSERIYNRYSNEDLQRIIDSGGEWEPWMKKQPGKLHD